MPFGFGLGDCCCVCGAFCSGGECGDSLALQGTTSGATNGGCASCAALNAVFALDWARSLSAAVWNSYAANTNGRSAAAIDAKAGTRVCQWDSADGALACSVPFQSSISSLIVTTYFGTDDKWHASALFHASDGFGTYWLGGDAEFPGGGGPIDCAAFSLSIPLSPSAGTPFYCNPPTSILIENAP